MLEYHAAYYVIEDGWYMAKVLDFPGAVSQGRTLRSARYMIRDALRGLAEFMIEHGEPLPRPNARARDKSAVFSEVIAVGLRCEGGPSREQATADAASSARRVRLPSRRRKAHDGV